MIKLEINEEINKFLEETEWKKQQAEALSNPLTDPRLLPKITHVEQAIMDGIRLILMKLNPEYELNKEVTEIEKEVIIEPCSCGKPGIFQKEKGNYNNDTKSQYWKKYCEYVNEIRIGNRIKKELKL